MNNIIIGIDPDSKKHGVAVFKNKKLDLVYNKNTLEIYDYLYKLVYIQRLIVTVVIEDVKANNFAYSQSRYGSNQKTAYRTGNNLGKVQQAQIELERMIDYFKDKFTNDVLLGGVNVKLVKPFGATKKAKQSTKKIVVDGVEMSSFQAETGFKGRTNEDNRSAYYIAMKYINSIKPEQTKSKLFGRKSND